MCVNFQINFCPIVQISITLKKNVHSNNVTLKYYKEQDFKNVIAFDVA